jgi:hypothetical protein
MSNNLNDLTVSSTYGRLVQIVGGEYYDGYGNLLYLGGTFSIGPTGPTGLDGVQGPIGPTGLDGIQGPIGPTGLDGIQGPIGPTGLDGIQGPIGPTGLDGIQGPIGPTGLDGIQGPIGPTGLDGIQGPIGPTGLDGIQGPIGPTGLDGIQGPIGPTGLDGIQGPIGPTGLDGIQGPIGPTGLAGDKYSTNSLTTFSVPVVGTTASFFVDPYLAYTPSQTIIVSPTISMLDHFHAIITTYVALTGYMMVVSTENNGVSGETYSYWQVNLSGAVGVPGETGIQGPTGSQGIQGEIGPTGSQGIQGEIGPTGSQGIQGVQGPTGSTSLDWNYFVTKWSITPTLNTTIISGDIWEYTLSGTTRYRLVPTTYDATQDSFYSTFDGTTLSDLITSRG